MSYENITLEKGMYATDKGFTGTLESLDPSENYVGTPLEGLDAYQRQLKRFDIRVSGANSDTVQKFFSTTSSAALFPEYVSRAIFSGIEEEADLSKIIATTTKIDSKDYRTVSFNWGSNRDLVQVEEGAEIPTAEIAFKDRLIQLKKMGKMLTASYESLKFQRLDVFALALRQIGAHIAKQQVDEALRVLIEGDGEGNTCVIMPLMEDFKFSDMIELWTVMRPYKMNTLAVSNAFAKELYNTDEFKNPLAGINFQGTGSLGTPLGAEAICSDAVEKYGLRCLAIDRRYALEKIVAADVTVESDKLIDRQIERTAISSIVGFAKLADFASMGIEKA